MSAPELVALMLADARLPTGGHTQSAGLEPAVRAGLGAGGNKLDEVAQYARGRLRTVTRVEAAAAVVARHVVLNYGGRVAAGAESGAPDGAGAGAGVGMRSGARTGVGPDSGARAGVGACGDDCADGAAHGGACVAVGVHGDGGWMDGSGRTVRARLLEVARAWGARTPSQALRAASRRQGRACLRLAGRVWPAVLDHLEPDAEPPRPLVLGVVAAVNGLSARQTARLVGYEDAQTVIAASLKLLPVDPTEAAGWLVGLHPTIEALVADVAELTSPAEIPAYGAPLIDQFAQQHTIDRMRLFHA